MAKLLSLLLVLFLANPLLAQLGASNIGNITIAPDSVGFTNIGKAETSKCAIPGPCGTTCAIYTFIGAGKWSIEGNWEANLIPPAVLTGCFEIIIDPANNAECVLDISMQMLPPGSTLIVKGGKKFRIPGEVVIK